MATIDCATIIKRGYLSDKKANILERKRWFVLRQDLGQGYCILEHYKDEKSANRGESPKGFINIYHVVDVHRLSDKKQCFELLCPGLAHRLMANSEADAEEWVTSIYKLIVAYKEDIMTSSVQRVIAKSMASGANTPPLSGSPPKLALNPMIVSSSLTIPQSTHPFSPSAMTNSSTMFTTAAENPHSPNVLNQIQQSYPTPPESIATTAVPLLQKQSSVEATHPYPSPPSSDSSSMCSGSNASFDNASIVDGDTDNITRSKFRVHVKESDRLAVSGPCDIVINEDGIALHSIQTGYPLASWPISSIRRYGVNNVCFTFETGRNCFTGEGKFFFYCPQSRMIHSRVHYVAQRKDHRRASAPADSIRTVVASQTLPANFTHFQHQRSAPIMSTDGSPPQYNHIEHALRPNFSIEPYGRIGSRSTAPSAGPPTHSTPTHTTPTQSTPMMQPEYERLNHKARPFVHSHTLPLMHTCNYVTIQHNHEEEEGDTERNISPIYSNVRLPRENEEEEESEDEAPPPLPPRLAKMNST